MKFRIIRCLCWKGESAGQSINNPRNQENAGNFNTEPEARKCLKHLEDQESERVTREQKSGNYNGNSFVFWIEQGE